MQSLQKADSHMLIELWNGEMAESKGIQAVVNQASFQTAMAVMMAWRGTDMGPHLAKTANLRKPQWQRLSRVALEKPPYQWNVQDRFIWIAELWDWGNEHSRNEGIWGYWQSKGPSNKELDKSEEFATYKNIFIN